MMSPAYMKEIDEYKETLASVGVTPQPISYIDETDLYALYLIPSELRTRYETYNRVVRFMEDGKTNGLLDYRNAKDYVVGPLASEVCITRFFYFVKNNYACIGLEEII